MVGIQIAQLRKLHKLSQSALADKLRVSVATIKNWETGNTEPRIQNIIHLCVFFNVSTDYLLGQNMRHAIYHENLDEDDIIVLNMMIQHILNLKHKK